MLPQVFPVTGHKMASLLAGDDALYFSSQGFSSAEEFQTAWDKRLSLATKVKLAYGTIRSVRKEDHDNDVVVTYRSFVGTPAGHPFSFQNPADCDTFFAFLQQERQFSRQYERMKPLKAVANYLLGAVAALALTVFGYLEALKIANGTAAPATSGKEELFNNLVGFLGDKGVLAVGGLGLAYLLYKVWARFTNPPYHQLFLPPAA